jgi:hypothetical protein
VLRAEDVRALNAIQHLNAHKNIYFSSWDSRDAVTEQAGEAQKERAKEKNTFKKFAHDESAEGEVYHAGSVGTGERKRALIAGTVRHPRPPKWPSFLRYRAKQVTFSNGSMVGHVRKEEWLRARPGR